MVTFIGEPKAEKDNFSAAVFYIVCEQGELSSFSEVGVLAVNL